MQREAVFEKSARPNEAYIEWDQFEKVCLEKTSHPHLPYLYKIFGNSRFLTRWLIQHPEGIKEILNSPFLFRAKNLKNYSLEIKKLIKGKIDEDIKTLRFYKYRELCRITLRDLNSLGNFDEILEELSFLAKSILASLDYILLKEDPKKIPPYSALALGKLGGNEINYSSDVDLICIAKDLGGSIGLLTASQFFIHHLQTLNRLSSEMSPDGFLYRLDWDLRPMGRQGNLICSFQTFEDYHEAHSAPWEKQALIKASPLFGSPEFGIEIINWILPFIYRKYLDVSHFKAIEEMKIKIETEQMRKNEKGFHVKLGYGGIREIEFFVQSLLLVFGGQKLELRTSNTREGLRLLFKYHFISKQNFYSLDEAYCFFRRLEHALQMVDERQTHFLPYDEASRLQMARLLGYGQEPNEAYAKFQGDLNGHAEAVHTMFQNLLVENTSSLKSFTDSSGEDWNQELNKALSCVKDYEEKIEILRLFQKEKLKNIKKLEENKLARRREILRKLSGLAITLCQAALLVAIDELRPIYGDPIFFKSDGSSDLSSLILLGMGKLGASEINYGSDLDLIFIFSESGKTNGSHQISNTEYFARLTQKFISLLSVQTLHGRCYEIDCELRPSGHQGTLVTKFQSFMDYQSANHEVWEKQALLRASPIAGPSYLSRLIQGHIEALIYSQGMDPTIRHEMDCLRERVLKEKAKEGKDVLDFKLGLGGLMDIEYILQYFQLTHAWKVSRLRVKNTFEGLDALATTHLLNPEACEFLREAYVFYRTLESKIALLFGYHVHRLKKDSSILQKVYLLMEYKNPESLYEEIARFKSKVALIYKDIFKKGGKNA